MNYKLRLGFLPVIVVLLLALLQGTSLAQQPSPDLPPEKAKQFLELLSDPELKAWLERKIPAATDEPGLSISEDILRLEGGVRARIGALGAAIPRLPEELSRAAEIVSRDVNSGRPGLVMGILAVLIAVGFGAEWAVRRALAATRSAVAQEDAGQAILFETVALLTFALASAGSFLALGWPPLLRRIILTLLLAFIAFRVVRAAARLLFAYGGATSAPSDRPTPLFESEASTRFWRWRVSLVAGFLLFGWAIASLMPGLGFSQEVAELAAFLFGLGILATAIDVVWQRPDGRGSLVKQSFLTLFLIVLWGAWVAGLLGVLWLGIFALVLPTALRGVGAAAQAFAGRSKRSGAMGVVLNVLIVRGARAAVIAAAVAWLAYIWRIRAASLAGSETGGFLITGLLNGIIILLIADLLWQLSKALIEYQMNLAADGSSADQLARSGRLRTLLPIFRNALAVFIAAVTVLTILAGLGVQILPLIAGAGIFGIAIGFGSQTLVKDVLSGVFYMMDDAFRVGEYIQSGSYKGTVESFSLRSVRLRHHRGPVYTVPFGELGAVQNMSRDWVIDKMMINITYDSDVDLARKLIKKIGQELAADPEFAADTIEPLKMQGIDSFGEYAIVLRIKLTTKPGTQFGIKRRAYMMIKAAFAENGIKMAVPTVHVESGGETAAAAHQATQTLKKSKAPLEAVRDTP
ncbi:mechanosensitive ion channel family protein [Mesorhizobium sp.]|uniref:mechanosensitive ion channel family protein n=1 Tax=Mesorhizobium sp. TaxID=1871066 RepID=UPI000FE73E12|nr:mechanosensitive ion channel family protein [Mesorhizobium sp.]RWP04164.1 MAG: mechanosensitive ion channel family protein [Mesorhizobium sp.]RWP31879.1 MAG: mechanosensitive ion channel family protein [Mesorhizobium sp.]RWP68126.1 MAG: mechanosensitive ion channel family protein [Mesorhizobium sp.]RWQ59582.1 MAG: mechanosensitive ion channel family protein [Mesorhizobium sp.]TIL37222.1 MAG: mechanosensitive ion channel family protein [Mesorhizobium sp.]